jgi:2-keto-4-pentenoate hydratase/2-oxohepta-3-ene-1,7-dioic acid hydratase in catechol pathway
MNSTTKGEPAVVVGRAATKVLPASAMDHAARCTIMNGISAATFSVRNVRGRGAKASSPGGPPGPLFVGVDGAPTIGNLSVRIGVNDELRQNESCW